VIARYRLRYECVIRVKGEPTFALRCVGVTVNSGFEEPAGGCLRNEFGASVRRNTATAGEDSKDLSVHTTVDAPLAASPVNLEQLPSVFGLPREEGRFAAESAGVPLVRWAEMNAFDDRVTLPRVCDEEELIAAVVFSD
jgi:hypothetical protein